MTHMSDRPTALERAFELAASGVYTSVTGIRERLKRDGFQVAQVTGRTLARQLRRQIKQAQKGGAP